MPTNFCRGLESEDLRVEEPVWEPILDALGERLTCGFMYMAAIELPIGTLHAYKHQDTRCYLHLTDDGRAFEWTGCERYVETRLDWAIEHALCSWWLLDGWEPEDRDAILAAVLKAQESMRESA